MLTEYQRKALFLEIHRAIESNATYVAGKLSAAQPPGLCYPPNGGFTDAEQRALRQLPAGKDLESALRKVIASAAYGPLFRLFCLLDGVGDPQDYDGVWLGAVIEPVPDDDEEPEEEQPMLHDALCETYWDWREK